MKYWLGKIVLLFAISLSAVSALECYECFSYRNEADCESMYNLKRVTCGSRYDTCVKVEMQIKIKQRMGDETKEITTRGYSRYCGKKTDCHSPKAICRYPWKNQGITVDECEILCCNDGIKASCHKTHHWPYGDGTIIGGYGNISDNKPQVVKGARGKGTVVSPQYYVLFLASLLFVT